MGAAPAGLKDPPTLEQARGYLLTALSQAPRTRKQLADLLAKRRVAPEDSALLLDRFEELQLIDDAGYAQAWVRYRHSVRGLTRLALRQELAQRGISPDRIEAALEQVDDEDERRVAYELATRRVKAMGRFDIPARERKLTAMLMRKGHSAATARVVARDVAARTLVE